MYIVSEKLNQRFATIEECQAAEAQYDRAQAEAKAKKEALTAERANRAKEVEEAYNQVVEAKKAYNALLDAFCKDYGSFHMTLKGVDPFVDFLSDWF